MQIWRVAPWGGPGSAFGGIWGILCFSAYSDLYYSGLFVTAFVFGYQWRVCAAIGGANGKCGLGCADGLFCEENSEGSMGESIHSVDVYAAGGLSAPKYFYPFLCEYGFHGDAVGGYYFLCAAQGSEGGLWQAGVFAAVGRDYFMRYVLL